jgi:uncharacterized SAM-binding protein YcdF (DUF218 family)
VSAAIVVPGNEVRVDGVWRISTACLMLVREAERLAASGAASVVVFTGWSRGGEPSEAEQMRDAWRGPELELVVEPSASVTAENAARTLPLLVSRGVRRALILCTPWHRHRTRFFFSRLYALGGVEAEVRAVPGPLGVRSFAHEVAALPLARRQLRAAQAELARRGFSG